MHRYYTRACNFYYGNKSKFLVKKKRTLPLSGSQVISFDHIEIISRNSKKKISLKKINSMPKKFKKQILLDFLVIISIWSKEISLILWSGSDLFFLMRILDCFP